MASLAEIRARIEAAENKGQNKGSNNQSDNAIFPFWNMSEGTTATLRYLPDNDPNNSFFWVERAMIKLPFNGIKGDPNSKPFTVQVPCNEMYGDNCPILAEVRPWYKDDSLKDLASKYWKKRTYLFQGFVRVNPLGDDVTPANPIRRFIITPQIMPIIKTGLMDPEMSELPTDYVNGLDFIIRKTSKGGYADYSTSNYTRKESPLTEAELAAIDTHGLFDLKSFLPKKPSDAELRVIKEMFEASVDGRPYDNDKWGAYYRPYGLAAPEGVAASQKTATAGTSATAATPTAHDSTDNETPPFDVDPVVVPSKVTPSTTSDKAQDILQMIRARQLK
jgi:hypothetical protein